MCKPSCAGQAGSKRQLWTPDITETAALLQAASLVPCERCANNGAEPGCGMRFSCRWTTASSRSVGELACRIDLLTAARIDCSTEVPPCSRSGPVAELYMLSITQREMSLCHPCGRCAAWPLRQESRVCRPAAAAQYRRSTCQPTRCAERHELLWCSTPGTATLWAGSASWHRQRC